MIGPDRVAHSKYRIQTIGVTNLFNVGSDEHDVHAAYAQLVDDQEPIDD